VPSRSDLGEGHVAAIEVLESMTKLPGVREGGMLRRNGQRKPGTTRGSPRCSRTAKALRISRHAVKSRCACGWGGWGRLSDDGPRQHNLSKSEDPWGGGLPNLQGGARSSARPYPADDRNEKSPKHPGRSWPCFRRVWHGGAIAAQHCEPLGGRRWSGDIVAASLAMKFSKMRREIVARWLVRVIGEGVMLSGDTPRWTRARHPSSASRPLSQQYPYRTDDLLTRRG
jgi:hypothetical protein